MPSVLIVDDESQIRDLLARWISGDGHQVREAITAAAALEDMQVAPSDIVLCDVHMPGESGLWLTGQLRTQFPEAAIVLATADRTVSPQVSMQPGVVQYLAKPFTREEVLEAVRLAAGWHETAVSERGRTKVSRPLPQEWIGTSGS
jgi:two-component system, OmpR family, phosphate regulon response regulator OmpR